ncbi:hypothetical protein [Comamonas sp.]|uniref:hypothetical protein n=1 Tax=Comamonas sp. TaxID=34028 RepID=UPI0028A00505|nr:hypothetical protein [Comamonas sp.]
MANPWDNDEIIRPAPTQPAAAPATAAPPPAIYEPQATQAQPDSAPQAQAAAAPSALATAPAANPWDNDVVIRPAPGATAAAPVAGTPASAPAGEASFVDKAVRGIGLGTRSLAQGLASVPAMVTDNLIAKPLNAAADAVMGEGNGPRLQMLKEATGNLATQVGLPQPETASERVAQDIVEGGAGSVAGVGAGGLLARAASPIVSAVGQGLAEGVGTQIASGAAAGAGSGIARENGGGEGAQLAAGLAAGLSPTVGAFAGKAAIRGAVRGGEAGRQQMADNIKTFEESAGITPTLGQATQSRGIQAAETALANVPGSSGLMARRGEQQAQALQSAVEDITQKLSPNANGWGAGEAIAKGVETFKNNVKTVQKNLYDKLDEHIPANTMISSDRTRAALEDLNAGIDGAPALSEWFKNARIQGIEGGLRRDTTDLAAILSRPGVRDQANELRGRLQAQAARIEAENAERSLLGMNNLQPVMTPEQIEARVQGMLTSKVDGQLPYESLKKLRTLVGQEISEGGLTADVPRSKWRALYAALSDDLGTAAEAAGPAAQQAWNRANQYTKASIQRLEQLESVVNRDAPEKIFKAATSGLSDGGTQINRVMKSMPIENRREVAAAVLQRLGRARNSAQDEMGAAFSPESFLTNLAAMSAPARTALFANSGFPGLRQKVEQMGKMASLRREGAQVFANPSGTARQAGLLGSVAGVMSAIATGNVAVLAGLGATAAGARLVGSWATNPRLVKSLADTTLLNPATPAAAINVANQAAQTEQPTFRNRIRAGAEAKKLGLQVVEVPGGWRLAPK